MLKVKNWSSYQSYKDRRPPWIRFQKSILDDYDYQSMSADARALLPMLWLLASEDEDPLSGLIRSSYETITFRLRMDKKLFVKTLGEVIDKGFITDLQAIEKQACNETVTKPYINRNETVTPETEAYSKEAYSKETEKKDTSCASDFETFWTTYPKNNGSKKLAGEKYESAIKSGVTSEQLIAGARAYLQHVEREGAERRFIAHAATWLHQRRWEIEYTADKPAPAKQTAGKQTWSSAGAELIAKYEREAELERGIQIESGKNNINLIASS